jgi:hypothetical protein
LSNFEDWHSDCELSNSVLINWDVDYPIKKFKPPKDCNLEAVDTDKNWVVEREQLQDCEYLSNLVASFEEEYVSTYGSRLSLYFSFLSRRKALAFRIGI